MRAPDGPGEDSAVRHSAAVGYHARGESGPPHLSPRGGPKLPAREDGLLLSDARFLMYNGIWTAHKDMLGCSNANWGGPGSGLLDTEKSRERAGR